MKQALLKLRLVGTVQVEGESGLRFPSVDISSTEIPHQLLEILLEKALPEVGAAQKECTCGCECGGFANGEFVKNPCMCGPDPNGDEGERIGLLQPKEADDHVKL